MSNPSYLVTNLLDKMASADKDFRFMATNDMLAELQKGSIKLDDDSERKIVKMLIKLLEDKNGEVQNLAVKCLGPLVNKVKPYQVESIVELLCNNMTSDNEQLRDISSIGLKTVISDLPLIQSDLAVNVCKRITDKLSGIISQKGDISVQLEVLDIVADLLLRFGTLLQPYQEGLLNSLLPQLKSERQAVRKRTIIALSYFVICCSNQLYEQLVQEVLNGLDQRDTSLVITYTQCAASICRQAGHRFGPYIEQVMSLILKHIESGRDDELSEYCLQTFDSFVHRCPKEISPYIPNIISVCLKYLTYDPNYNYGDNGGDYDMDMDEMNGGGGGYGGEDDEDADDDDYSDDDDMTWKVRRSAAKCLEAVISTRRDMLCDFYLTVAPQLIDRFKEREENVRSDVFHTYTMLVKQTKMYPGATDTNSMEIAETPAALLQAQIPAIMKAVDTQLRAKSIKTRQDSLILLKEILAVLPGSLAEHISIIISAIQYSMGEKNTSSNMKIDALSFLHCLLSTHPPEVFHPHVHIIVPVVVNAVNDNFYKIIAEALNALNQLVKVIRPLDCPSNFNFAPYTGPIYECTLVRLRTADIDQEVKEQAISCMGQIISNFGDYLQAETATCLPIFLDRLRNEITRLTAVKALTKISVSPLRVDLKPITDEGVPLLASFLRKNYRTLKLSTLALLDRLVLNYSNILNVGLVKMIVQEVPPLVVDSDLHVAHMALNLLTSIASTCPKGIVEVPVVLDQVLELLKSPLLQGAALNSVLNFFEALVKTDFPGLRFKDLLLRLDLYVSQPLHKQAYYSLAKCLAAITSSKPDEAVALVMKFIDEIEAGLHSHEKDEQNIFPLLVIGEIGKHVDLNDVPNLKDLMLRSISSPGEETKSAASYALGCMAIGNLQQYLPFILKQIECQPKRQYLLLHSLKDVICWQSASTTGVSELQQYIPEIWQQLYKHCECTEEGTRNVVAECLGKLTLLNPTTLLPKLEESLNSTSALMRTTALTAIKFTINDQPQPIDPLLKQTLSSFVTLMRDEDTCVRRVALVAFNSAAHNKPSLIRDYLKSILPQLYAETEVKKHLIREVEMGPFKHTVDDGLDIRKAAFECMYTLLDTCLDRLDLFEFLNYLEQGLKDHYDIKMLSYLMLIRVVQLAPNAVIQRLEKLIEPLRSTCMLKVKANSVKQEFEKQDELKRSAIRAVAVLAGLPDSDKCPAWNEFMSQIKAQPDLRKMLESVKGDGTLSSPESSVSMEIG